VGWNNIFLSLRERTCPKCYRCRWVSGGQVREKGVEKKEK